MPLKRLLLLFFVFLFIGGWDFAQGAGGTEAPAGQDIKTDPQTLKQERTRIRKQRIAKEQKRRNARIKEHSINKIRAQHRRHSRDRIKKMHAYRKRYLDKKAASGNNEKT